MRTHEIEIVLFTCLPVLLSFDDDGVPIEIMTLERNKLGVISQALLKAAAKDNEAEIKAALREAERDDNESEAHFKCMTAKERYI